MGINYYIDPRDEGYYHYSNYADSWFESAKVDTRQGYEDLLQDAMKARCSKCL